MELLYDHVCASLSELDMEMIKAIPPGGNWKDIPFSTARKSARLMQIRESGGRTTYYGRMRGDLPSYTISTYFNRPGNGSFIHPNQDRLISLREAARLQSFPDCYRFMGSMSSKFKQIGNAVPPLLGRSLGSMFKVGRVVDLFAGAGGLSEGLRMAGHSVVFASDINPTMVNTLTHNHPATEVVEADLTKDEDLNALLERIDWALAGRSPRLLVGGPPCQGFSSAGKLDPADLRNNLYVPFLSVVDAVRPEHVIIENVPGMKWFQRGKVFNEIQQQLNSMGYSSQWLELKAEQYGVPQRRRRVFIVASESRLDFQSPTPLFSFIERGRRREDVSVASMGLPAPVSVSEAISDLPKISSGGGEGIQEYSPNWTKTSYQNYMRGTCSFEGFMRNRENSG